MSNPIACQFLLTSIFFLCFLIAKTCFRHSWSLIEIALKRAEWSKLTRRARWIFMVYWSNLHPLLRAGYLQLTCCLSYKLLPHYHSFLWNLAARDIKLMLNNSAKRWKKTVSGPEWRHLKFPAICANESGLEGTTRTSFSPWTWSMDVVPSDFRHLEDKCLHLHRSPVVPLVQRGGRPLWRCDPIRHLLWEERNKVVTSLTSTSAHSWGLKSPGKPEWNLPQTRQARSKAPCACIPAIC